MNVKSHFKKYTIVVMVIVIIGGHLQINVVSANNIQTDNEGVTETEIETHSLDEMDEENNDSEIDITDEEKELEADNVVEEDEDTNDIVFETNDKRDNDNELTNSIQMLSSGTVIKNGDRHPDVIKLKQDLNTLGFSNFKNPTNLYASQTEKAVKELQKYYKLSADGIAGPATFNKVKEVLNSSFQNGKRHKDTIQLKKDLNTLGYADIKNPNDFYGSQTKAAVIQFQKDKNLPVSGIAESVTRKEIKQAVGKIVDPNNLKNGDRHTKVIQLKKDLNTLGFSNFKNPTNLYASQTEKAVRDLQKYYKLSVDGVAGPATFRLITDVLNSPFQSGKRHKDTIQLKKDLNTLGYANFKNPNNLYASQTKAAVIQFQKDKNLPMSGIAESVTRKEIKKAVANDVDPNNLKSGDRHPSVIQLKKDLNKLGFSNFKKPNDYYASQTTKAVEDFQRFFKLKVTGIADKQTQSKIKELANSPFQNGKRHEETILIKIHLNILGYANINNPNNLYGSQTKAAVIKFQQAKGLPASGIADKETRDALKKAAGNTIDVNYLKSGDRHTSVIQLKKDLNTLGFSNFKNPNNYYASQTEKAVRDFQVFFKLIENGIADPTTQSKIKELVNSPLQSGKRHKDTIKLKQDLNRLGYSNFKNPNNLYASQTKAAVEKFQKDHGIPASGIADQETLNKIKDALKSVGSDKTEYTNYNITLNKALDIQMARPTIITDKYKNDPAYVSAKYINLSGDATITGTGVNVRTSPNTSSSVAFQLSKGEKITITGEAKGTSVSGSTLWYEFKRNNKTYYVHSSLVSTSSGTVTGNVNVRAGKGTSHHIFGKLAKDAKVTILEQGTNWHKISYSTWRNPTRNDMKAYLDPNKNDKMQHLRLDSSVGVSASQLNKVLSGKGILAGKGQAFINGTKKYGVNEAYLIAHAQLETGNGTSSLAKGVKYNGKTVYNMYGIGAVDSDPLNGGAKTAYENGWFTPEAAIEGGAEWISKQYIQNQHKQNTLYKMKWNPNMNNGYAWKQYATDIAWAVKQIPQIKNIYNQLDNPTYHYDIAKYK